MSRRKDTDYLALSARIKAMENRLLTRDRLERMIDAREDAEALKVLSECGYPAGQSLDEMLARAQADIFADLRQAAPEEKVVEIFQLKYDYHNAKVLVKAAKVGTDGTHLLLAGGRYAPLWLRERVEKDELQSLAPVFADAIAQAIATLAQTGDPQLVDVILDRACAKEMGALAAALESTFLQGYVRMWIDVTNLRTAVRVHRMGQDTEFLKQVLIAGGSVSEQSIAQTRAESLGDLYAAGYLAEAASKGAQLTQAGSGQLTEFERACDNALMAYLGTAARVPFGEETLVGYLYARESELTAIRTIFAGRAAGLDGETIRSRLRETYV